MSTYKNIYKLLLVANLTILTACATTYVEHEPTTTRPVSSAIVLSAPTDSSVPTDLVNGITSSVKRKLYRENGYDEADELTIQFKVFGENDARGFLSGWWNESFSESDKQLINVGVIYSDSFDTQLAEIEVEVEIGTGEFQVSRNDAIDTIANHIVDFTKQYFPNAAY